MIIIQIFGGLGNQLFQYAAARAQAERHGTEVKLDVSRFEDYTLRRFDLAKLSLPFSIATAEEVLQLKANNTIQRVKARLLPHRLKRFYKQPFFHYDSSFFHLGKNVYLQGYFQSAKYFLPIKNTIRREYNFEPLVADHIKKEGERLKHTVSVSVHIRRGDYNNPEMQNIHGILPIGHYQNAMDVFKKNHPGAKFYIFSDEPEAAVKELQFADAVVVSGRTSQTHFEDLYLMSCCRHNIIANSSFSWWAAWLNNHPNKIVVAPKTWFHNGPKDVEDLLPEDWIRL